MSGNEYGIEARHMPLSTVRTFREEDAKCYLLED